MTIVQRSATCVISRAALEEIYFKLPFSDQTPIEELDLRSNSMPLAFLLQLMKSGGIENVKMFDKELHDGLRKAGFKLTWETWPGSGDVGVDGFVVEHLGSGSSMVCFLSTVNSFTNHSQLLMLVVAN